MKTFVPEVKDIDRQWLLIDAAGKPLGRLAVTIANLLRGRGKPTFTPHVDTGDFVVVINAGKVALTGRKEQAKTYDRYTGYRGGLKTVNASTLRAKHPECMIELAVKGMMPKNNLARGSFARLKVYTGAAHPHAAQNPRPIES